jgi:hypothetical protein
MERARAEELEASLDRLCIAASRKAADIDRQRADFEAAASAHAALQAAHAEALAQGQALAARAAEAERELAAERRLAAGARQGLADKERQVAVLAAEVERLQGRQVTTDDAPGGPSPGDGADAGAIISARLVSFRSVAQLVERNTQLLAVARSLADDLDAARQGAVAQLEAARASAAAGGGPAPADPETERRIAELTEMCTALAAEAAACKRAADEALRDSAGRDQAGGGSPSRARARGGGSGSSSELEAAERRIADLEAALAAQRQKAADAADALQQQVDAARAAERAARGDEAAARAQQEVAAAAAASLQQQLGDAQARGERLAGQAAEHRSQLERLEAQLEQVGSLGWRRLGQTRATGLHCFATCCERQLQRVAPLTSDPALSA